DVQRAGRFARRRAHPPGELREVVGRMQVVDRPAPLTAVHQVVPVRDDVVDRTAGLAERNAAIHAARALLRGLGALEPRDELAVVAHARGDGFAGLGEASELEKTGDLSHSDQTLDQRSRPAATRLAAPPPSPDLRDEPLPPRALPSATAGPAVSPATPACPVRSAAATSATISSRTGSSAAIGTFAEPVALAAAAARSRASASSASARRYSRGKTLTNFARIAGQPARISRARKLPV